MKMIYIKSMKVKRDVPKAEHTDSPKEGRKESTEVCTISNTTRK